MSESTASIEGSVLGSIMSHGGLSECRESGLCLDWFQVPANREIFQALCECPEGVHYPIAVTHLLREKGRLEAIGGWFAINDRVSDAVPPSGRTYLIGILRDKWKARKFTELCMEAVASANEGCDIDSASSALLRGISDVMDGKESDSDKATIRDRVLDFRDHIEELYDKGDAITGIPVGVSRLDSHSGGMQPGELWVICGHTKSGKTALATQALRATCALGKWASLFSLEMTGRQTIGRLVAAEGKLSGSFFRHPKLMKEGDFQAFEKGTKLVAEMPLCIYERKRTLTQISTTMRRDKRQKDIALAVVDYGQLVDGEASSRESREKEVARISSTLKGLAVDLGICVILLSQTNDDGKLRESRAIGHDADCVLRVKVPGKKDDPKEPDLACSRRIISIEYARSFGMGDFEVEFINNQARFV